MSGMPTTQQRRAKHAWETARAAATSQQVIWDEFDREVKRLGPRIVTAGLGHAIAFADANKGSELVRALSVWVLQKGEVKTPTPNLQQRIREGNSDELRRWTAEALEWITWVKRFCEAETKERSVGGKKARGDE